MSSDLAELCTQLAVSETAPDVHDGVPGGLALPQLFGGHALAQAVVAAGRSTPPVQRLRSLHALFLASGNGHAPLRHTVTTLRDGRSVTSRGVTVSQQGRRLAELLVSFGAEGDGSLDHQVAARPAPPPQDCPSARELAEATPGVPNPWDGFGAVDVRVVGPRAAAPGDASHVDRAWMRVQGEVGDDDLLHAALLTYCSDLTLLSSVLVPSGLVFGLEHDFPDIMAAVSLDHSLRIHRRPTVDDWLLFEQTSPLARGARGLATARVFDRAGHLVATVAQEVMLRRG